MINANQTFLECYKDSVIKPYTVEWLKIEGGMTDPLVSLYESWPNSNTQTTNRDIDFIYTYGISIQTIMTLVPNFPAQSDHLGIVFDIDMASYFSSSFSDLGNNPPRSLTSGNKRSVDTYIKYVSEQLDNHNIERRISDLYRSLSEISTIFSYFPTWPAE